MVGAALPCARRKLGPHQSQGRETEALALGAPPRSILIPHFTTLAAALFGSCCLGRPKGGPGDS